MKEDALLPSEMCGSRYHPAWKAGGWAAFLSLPKYVKLIYLAASLRKFLPSFEMGTVITCLFLEEVHVFRRNCAGD